MNAGMDAYREITSLSKNSQLSNLSLGVQDNDGSEAESRVESLYAATTVSVSPAARAFM